MIQLEVDGKPVEIKEGSMVMDAASKAGIYIPHFCYHKKLTIAANCRMCLVEIEKAPKPMPACATPVTAGMVVRTASAKAIQAQKGVMEFLLINHPLDCPICDQGGECQLQDLAVGYGGSNSRYAEEKRVVFKKDIGPLISTEGMTRCIQCTRCVRFGQEIAGIMELGMVNRGEHSEITTFVGKTVDSELSGNMIDICPVGALLSKPFLFRARTWEMARRKSVSPHDGLGANLIVQVAKGRVLRVVPLENEDVNECWLSDRDRFSYEGANSDDRLTTPMMRDATGTWRAVDWPEALEAVATRLKSVVETHGADAVGALATPHSTLEELHLVTKLMRGLGSDHVDTRLRQSDFGDAATSVAPWLGMPVARFAELDRVLVVGSFLRKDQPLLAQRLRQSVRRGALLSTIHAADDDLLMPVANKVLVPPSQWRAALEAVDAAARADESTAAVGAGPSSSAASSSTSASFENARSIAKSFASGTNKAILLGSAVTQHPQFGLILDAARALAVSTGATLGILTEAANSVGAQLVDARPIDGGLDARAMLEQPRRAYLLVNVEPDLDLANPPLAARALKEAELVVALTPFKSTADRHADVLLPITPFTETSGTFVNTEGRAQSFNGAVKPMGESRPGWKVLRVLGNMLGLAGFEYESSEAVRTEVTGGATDLSDRCGSFVDSASGPSTSTSSGDDGRIDVPHGRLERVADVPIYFADALVRRSPPLQLTRDAEAPVARMNSAVLAASGLVDGDAARFTSETGEAVLRVRRDETIADRCVRIAAAHPSTAALGAMNATLAVAKTDRQPDEQPVNEVAVAQAMRHPKLGSPDEAVRA